MINLFLYSFIYSFSSELCESIRPVPERLFTSVLTLDPGLSLVGGTWWHLLTGIRSEGGDGYGIPVHSERAISCRTHPDSHPAS